jgi:ketosteroid isomerase-like protein
MKNLLFLCILSCFCITATAQTKDVKDISAAVQKLTKAMIDGERTALQDIAADKLSYGHSGGLVEDKPAFVEHIASGKSDFVTIDISEQTIAVSGDAAIVRHLLNATTNDNNVPGTVKLRILLLWQKQKGEWKLLARQAVKG